MKKDIFAVFAYDFKLSQNHGEAVYIINSAGIVFHQHKVLHIIIEKRQYSLRLIICAYGDDMHADA